MDALMPDPMPLYTLADAISSQAEALRTRARTLIAAMDGMRWTSAAATEFRSSAREITAGMSRSADEVERAADLLRIHAGRVAAALPGIGR